MGLTWAGSVVRERGRAGEGARSLGHEWGQVTGGYAAGRGITNDYGGLAEDARSRRRWHCCYLLC